MVKLYRNIWLLSIILTEPLPALPQIVKNPSPLYFDHLDMQHGLSSNEINCIFRDSRGFLWIGTNFGLDEYDGRDIKVILNNRYNPQSIVGNIINSICEDDSGYLWIGTNKGISCLNPYNFQSTNYQHDEKRPYSLNDNFKCLVYIDKSGIVWVGNQSGLSYFDRRSKHFHTVTILPNSLNKPALTDVNSFLEDREGRLWLGTYSGLVLYDREAHRAQLFTLYKDGPPGLNCITSIFQDHANRIWTGIWGEGLCLFDLASKTFTPHKWNSISRFKSAVNLVFSITETQSRYGRYSLWLATSKGLIKAINPDKKGLFSFVSAQASTPDPNNPHSLSSSPACCMLQDIDNTLWIGTNRGLNIYMPRNQHFINMPVVNGSVTKILVDSYKGKHHFFITSWYGDGLTELNEKFHRVHVWQRIPPNAPQTDNGQVSDIIRTRDGFLWIATFNGLYRFDQGNNKFTAYLHKVNDTNSISGKLITALAEDNKGFLWIGTYAHGLDKYDPHTKIFTHYRHSSADTSSLISNHVSNLYLSPSGQLWIGTLDGMGVYDPEKDDFKNYPDQEKQANVVREDNINQIVVGHDGTCWVATSAGLKCLNTQTGKFELFNSDQGLKYNEIKGMAFDSLDRLWVVGYEGIAIFKRKQKIFINYDEPSGLYPAGPFTGPIIQNWKNEMVVGGESSLVRFNPFSLEHRSEPPGVYITGISVNGQSLSVKRDVGQAQQLSLSYPSRTFSATFDAPCFFNGQAVKYAYKLEGLDRNWTYSGGRNFVTYANLPPGKYKLDVRASNGEGIWNMRGAFLSILVLPPFWSTWWFRISSVLFLSLLLYSIFVYRIRTVRREEAQAAAVGQQLAGLRLKVLRTQMNPHFLFNALNSIQDCIYTHDTNTASHYLAKFSRLVRLILEQSEHNTITISGETELLQLYLQLESLRFQHSFDYRIDTGSLETHLLKLPPMLLQPYVENALWHGLLKKKGKKELLIIFQADEKNIYVSIEDNGIGRAASLSDKSKKDLKQQSLGISLATRQLDIVSYLTHQRATVFIEDLFSAQNEPAGTRVKLTIPINYESAAGV